MKTVDLIIKSVTSFYSELQKDENGRYHSWEHCYTCFCDARKMEKPDYDYLSLMLAFYLASWGMYRGSSFLLQKDYKVHIPVVEEIMKTKYDCLVGIKCTEFGNTEVQDLVFKDLHNFMKEHYKEVRASVVDKEPKQEISDVLITKILMGTLACVPAYDRYFVAGIKKEQVSTGNYNKDSIIKLVDFYEKNYKELETVRKGLRVGKREYPQMKMIDMGFWQIGFDLDMNKGIQKVQNESNTNIIT